MIEMQLTSAAPILAVRLTGTLVADDYARIVPDIERRIRDVGKLRLLVIMHEFHGWNAGARVARSAVTPQPRLPRGGRVADRRSGTDRTGGRTVGSL